MSTYRVYCDESCHLEQCEQQVMLLGCAWLPSRSTFKFSNSLRELKKKHNANGELKWLKVSASRQAFYLDLVDWFFSQKDLNFRCVVVADRSKLNHSYYNQGSHDSFYYKMYYQLIRNVLSPQNRYEIYVDIKDTRSQRKILKLKEILSASCGAGTGVEIPKIQHVRSHESELTQLADFLLGAVSYRCRDEQGNSAKLAVVQRIFKHTGHDLKNGTPPWEPKFNVFLFSPSEPKP